MDLFGQELRLDEGADHLTCWFLSSSITMTPLPLSRDTQAASTAPSTNTHNALLHPTATSNLPLIQPTSFSGQETSLKDVFVPLSDIKPSERRHLQWFRDTCCTCGMQIIPSVENRSHCGNNGGRSLLMTSALHFRSNASRDGVRQTRDPLSPAFRHRLSSRQTRCSGDSGVYP